MIESLYLVFALIGTVALHRGMPTLDHAMSTALFCWFFLQALGFYVRLYLLRDLLGVVISTLLLAMVFLWYATIEHSSNALLVDGLFLMWGEDAPRALQLCYLSWFVYIGSCSTQVLPNIRQVPIHLASITVAMLSGSFFFVRLVTACNLFLLDLVFDYSAESRRGFSVLSESQHERFERSLQPWIGRASLLVCSLAFTHYLIEQLFL